MLRCQRTGLQRLRLSDVVYSVYVDREFRRCRSRLEY